MSDMRNDFDGTQNEVGRDGGNTLEHDRMTRGEIGEASDTEMGDTEIDEDNTEESGG